MLKPMKPSWHTSWIVMSNTYLPPPEKYDDTNTHPDLCRRNWVITTGAELALLCELL